MHKGSEALALERGDEWVTSNPTTILILADNAVADHLDKKCQAKCTLRALSQFVYHT